MQDGSGAKGRAQQIALLREQLKELKAKLAAVRTPMRHRLCDVSVQHASLPCCVKMQSMSAKLF
eukprot:3695446-Pleurochrysis_carterae.AAC.2